MASGDRTPYDEAVSDFEAAFERLAKVSGDKDEQRRAWLEAVNHTYRLREHKKRACGKRAYEATAASHDYGKTTEGILVVRNIATHVLTVRANPESRMLYPGSKVYPSDYLYPGDGNLFWLDMHELDPAAKKAISSGDSQNYYRDKVGRPRGPVLAYTQCGTGLSWSLPLAPYPGVRSYWEQGSIWLGPKLSP